jgi:hypothetical protein
MTKVRTIALASSIPTAIGRRYLNRSAWPAAHIASTNARTSPTTTLDSPQKRFHGSKRPGMQPLESLSATPTHPWGDTGSISAIAQRLPAEADMRMPYRFREFEVCALAGRLSVTSWTDAFLFILARQPSLHCYRRSSGSWSDTRRSARRGRRTR